MAVTPIEVLRIVIRARNEASKAFKKAGMDFKSFVGTVETWAKRAVLAVSVMGTLIIKKAIEAFAEYDYLLQRVGLITGETIKNKVTPAFEELKRQVASLAAETQFTPIQVAEAAEAMALYGLTIKDVMDTLPGMINASVVAGEGLVETTDRLLTIMFQFDLPFSKMTEIADALSVAAVNSAATISLVGDAMKFVGPLAAAVGFSIKETVAMMTELANAGLRGSMSGTAMRQMLIRLMDTTGPSAKKLKAFGIEVANTEGRLKDLRILFVEMVEKGMTPEQVASVFRARAGIAATVFASSFREAMESPDTKESLAIIPKIEATLMASGKPKEVAQKLAKIMSKTFQGEILALMAEGAGQSEMIAERLMSTFRGALLKIEAASEQVFIAIGTILGDHLAPIIHDKVVPALKELADQIFKDKRIAVIFKEMGDDVERFMDSFLSGNIDIVGILETILDITKAVYGVILDLIQAAGAAKRIFDKWVPVLEVIVKNIDKIFFMWVGGKIAFGILGAVAATMKLSAALRTANAVAGAGILGRMMGGAGGMFARMGGAAGLGMAAIPAGVVALGAGGTLVAGMKANTAATKEWQATMRNTPEIFHGVEESINRLVDETGVFAGIKRLFGGTAVDADKLSKKLTEASGTFKKYGIALKDGFAANADVAKGTLVTAEALKILGQRYGENAGNIITIAKELAGNQQVTYDTIVVALKKYQKELKNSNIAARRSKDVFKDVAEAAKGNLERLLAFLSKTSDEIAGIFKKLGSEFKTVEEKFEEGAVKILGKVNEAIAQVRSTFTKTTTEEQKVAKEAKALEKIFGGVNAQVLVAEGFFRDYVGQFEEGKITAEEIGKKLKALAVIEREINAVREKGVKVPEQLLENLERVKALTAEAKAFAIFEDTTANVLAKMKEFGEVTGNNAEEAKVLSTNVAEFLKEAELGEIKGLDPLVIEQMKKYQEQLMGHRAAFEELGMPMEDFITAVNTGGVAQDELSNKASTAINIIRQFPNVFEHASQSTYLLEDAARKAGDAQLFQAEATWENVHALEALAEVSGGYLPENIGTAGKAFKGVPVPTFQHGTPFINKPTLGIVGDKPEAIVPLSGGRNIPVELHGGGQAIEVSIINVLDPGLVDSRIAASEGTIMNMIGRSAREDRKVRRVLSRG